MQEKPSSFTIKSKKATQTGATPAVRAQKDLSEKEGRKEGSRSHEYEWHMKTASPRLMYNPVLHTGDVETDQLLNARLTLVADSLWEALLEEKNDDYKRVAKTRHWHGSLDEEKPQHFIASRILDQKANRGYQPLPTLYSCTQAKSAWLTGGKNKTLSEYQHPFSDTTDKVENASVIRGDSIVKMEGFGIAAVVGLILCASDLHGDNFAVRDQGNRIQLCKFDNKYALGTSTDLESRLLRKFFSPELMGPEAGTILNAKKVELKKLLAGARGKEKTSIKFKQDQVISEIQALKTPDTPVLEAMKIEGDLDRVLRFIFPTLPAETKGMADIVVSEAYKSYLDKKTIFKFPFEPGFATAPHVKGEFMDAIYVMTHMAPDKIGSMIGSLLSTGFISPVTGKPVSELVMNQLMKNINELAVAVEHCPEYQAHIREHSGRLETKKAEAEGRLERSTKELALGTPKSTRSFTHRLAEERGKAKGNAEDLGTGV